MPFESLPAELQIEIFSHLEGSHLKAVRGVCHAFRDNAEPALFRYVIAASRYQSLGAFQKISLFSVFQKHVREIVFDGSLYDKQLAQHEKIYHTQAARFPNLEQGFHWHNHGRCVMRNLVFKSFDLTLIQLEAISTTLQRTRRNEERRCTCANHLSGVGVDAKRVLHHVLTPLPSSPN